MKKIPDHLNHKPIVKLENYETVDGKYKNKSDAKGFSIGIAQWDKSENRKQLSAKIFRYDGQWSPQSEELPLHRVLDLASLICSVLHEDKYGNFIDVKGLKPEMSNDDHELKNILKNGLNDEREHIRKSFDNLASTILKTLSEDFNHKNLGLINDKDD